MSKLSWWKRTVMTIGVVVAAAASTAIRPKEGRTAEPPEPAQAPGQAFQYAGSTVCKGCHNVTKENPANNFPLAVGFIKLDECATWDKEDKHSIAFKRLNSDRGRRMASLLKVDVNLREAGCLGCHSASTSEIKNRQNQGDQFNPSEGVSCENCHGPSSGWFAPHLNVAFRKQSPEEWSKVGFNDLRSPDRQAEKCLSCHIGNSDEGKVVTHEMYAAGHPPLPSIEVATFNNSIPRHWWLLGERKDPNLRKALGFKEGELEQTKLAVVGAAVALKTSMKLLAREAKAVEKGEAPGQEWPDYARFDCWSCHHDLKRESWRQARGYVGSPGRVPVSQWPLALVELGIDRISFDNPADAAALRADLLRFQKELHQQANSRPFGKKDSLAAAADDLASWADVLAKKLTASSFDRDTASKLLNSLVAQARKSTPDYDTARHVAWTIKILVEDIGDKLSKPKVEAIRPIVARLVERLKLKLPAGKEYEIEDNLGSALQTIGDYEPSQFQADLEQLAEVLRQK